jgi:hypothetical protein
MLCQVFNGRSGEERDTAVIAGVVGFEGAERELLSARVERVGGERIGHGDDLSAARGYVHGKASHAWPIQPRLDAAGGAPFQK